LLRWYKCMSVFLLPEMPSIGLDKTTPYLTPKETRCDQTQVPRELPGANTVKDDILLSIRNAQADSVGGDRIFCVGSAIMTLILLNGCDSQYMIS
jgi:hypothetical protein